MTQYTTAAEAFANRMIALEREIEDLKGKSRRRPLVITRQIAMYMTRQLTDLSFPVIAREFGGRDHTTVRFGIAAHQARLDAMKLEEAA